MILRTIFRGVRLTVYADYDPPEPVDRYCPPCDELLIMGAIRGPHDERVALSDRQLDELETQLLAEMQREAEYNAYCDRT